MRFDFTMPCVIVLLLASPPIIISLFRQLVLGAVAEVPGAHGEADLKATLRAELAHSLVARRSRACRQEAAQACVSRVECEHVGVRIREGVAVAVETLPSVLRPGAVGCQTMPVSK